MHVHVAGRIIRMGSHDCLRNFAVIANGVAVPLGILGDGDILRNGSIEDVSQITKTLLPLASATKRWKRASAAT